MALPATTVQGMQDLLIPGPTGNVRLGDIATVTQAYGPPQITHLGGVRTATVSATITSSNIGAVSQDVQQRINKLSLPAGATVSLGGVTASQSQAFSGSPPRAAHRNLAGLPGDGSHLPQHHPTTYPAGVDPVCGHRLDPADVGTHTTLGVPALIGLLMLVGIVVTNAIVLLDLVNQYRAKGLDARAAVVEGGRRRLRPILMTAIATILALLPMALGLSKAGVFIAGPLAIVVIGGLTTSTILTCSGADALRDRRGCPGTLRQEARDTACAAGKPDRVGCRANAGADHTRVVCPMHISPGEGIWISRDDFI